MESAFFNIVLVKKQEQGSLCCKIYYIDCQGVRVRFLNNKINKKSSVEKPKVKYFCVRFYLCYFRHFSTDL